MMKRNLIMVCLGLLVLFVGQCQSFPRMDTHSTVNSTILRGFGRQTVNSSPLNGYKYAYGRIEAENFDYNLGGSQMIQSGMVYMGYLDNGDVLGYYLVDFSSRNQAFGVKLTIQNANPNVQGTVNVYYAVPPPLNNSPAGTGTLGVWAAGFITVVVNFGMGIIVKGVADIYVEFKTTDTSNNFGIADFDYIEFF